MYLITTILLIVILAAIWLLTRKVKENFANSVGIIQGNYFTENFFAEPKGDIIVPPVDYGLAMKEIGDNLAREKKLIASLVPYYEKLVGIAAGNKVDPSKFNSKEEMQAAANSKRPEIRAALEKEEPGRVLPLFDINNALNTIAGSEKVADEVKYVVSYLYLPLEVVIYKSTAEFLNKKCMDTYNYLAQLGGKEGAGKIQGSSAESLGATISGFQDTDVNVSSASIKAKGNLQDIMSQYTVPSKENKMKIGPEDIQQLYRISTTRIRKLDELQLSQTILKELVDNFSKLNKLMTQLEQGNDKAYAAMMVDGKTPEEAINAFTDYEQGYAYLIR